jgi:hypothetical protein
MTDTEPTPGVERLTAEVVAIGGPLASIAWHMQETAARRGEHADIPAILGPMLLPALAELTDGWADERIDDAAAVLHAACQRVCDEILLVPPEPPRRRPLRRPR